MLLLHVEGIFPLMSPIQVEDILTEVQRKEEENRQLQEEMDAARQRYKQLSSISIEEAH